MPPLHEQLRQHARTQPEKPAFIWYGTAISYAELNRASDAFAAYLQALGILQGEPVALFMNNCPQYVIAHFGIQKIGAIVCPCGPLNKEHELAYQLNDLQAKVIVAASNLLPIVNQVREGSALEHVFGVRYTDFLPAKPVLDIPAELLAMATLSRELPEGVADFLVAITGSAQPQPTVIDVDDTALMTYTSGTTGLPKGAMLSYRNASYKTAMAAACSGGTKDDVLLAVAPLYHIAGMVMGMNIVIHTGATCVLLFRFDPLAVLQAISRYRISWWYSIAPMNMAIMQLPVARETDLSSLRLNQVTSFGITFTEEIAQRWHSFAPNCVACEASYGLSETHTVDTVMPLDAIRWGTHGKAIPGNEIRIIDPDTGQQCAAGISGEIVLRSPGVFKGYWNNPQASAQTLRDGWVYTGDIGKIDSDGYLTFLGRFKEMIKVSGYSVFPEEVEGILMRHPAIAQVAVVGIPDAEKGEIIKACIVLKPGHTAEPAAISAWSREHMANYKVPRQVEILTSLPSTGAGKVLRRLLK